MIFRNADTEISKKTHKHFRIGLRAIKVTYVFGHFQT